MKTSFNTFSLLGIEKSLRKSVFKIQLNQNQNPLLTPCPDSNLKLSVVLVFALQEISENLVIVFQLIEYNGHCDGYSGYANKSSKSLAANRTDSTNVHDFDYFLYNCTQNDFVTEELRNLLELHFATKNVHH